MRVERQRGAGCDSRGSQGGECVVAIDAVFTACAKPAGVTELRRGALERVSIPA
ncbi:MAG TPA: hypothetical protein VF951_17795 [Streptosporangiaceae bacterium]|nr:hypothetical protein [Streptosporangiaceae bacterium]